MNSIKTTIYTKLPITKPKLHLTQFSQNVCLKFKNLIDMKRVILLIQFTLVYSFAFSQCV